jgi:hypothetical protein
MFRHFEIRGKLSHSGVDRIKMVSARVRSCVLIWASMGTKRVESKNIETENPEKEIEAYSGMIAYLLCARCSFVVHDC